MYHVHTCTSIILVFLAYIYNTYIILVFLVRAAPSSLLDGKKKKTPFSRQSEPYLFITVEVCRQLLGGALLVTGGRGFVNSTGYVYRRSIYKYIYILSIQDLSFPPSLPSLDWVGGGVCIYVYIYMYLYFVTIGKN